MRFELSRRFGLGLKGGHVEDRDQNAGPTSAPIEAVAIFSSGSKAAAPPCDTARAERASCSEAPAPISAPSKPVSAWRPPEVIGDRFDCIDVIGSGGMGHVCRAWDKKLRRDVALKFILEPDEHARERFLREVHTTARIGHRNVVRIYDVMEWGDLPFIVMELLSGQNLHEVEKPLAWPQALRLGVELSCGLAAVHRVGVVHRDIKPSNVMLTDEGEVKLYDFGLAKFSRRSLTPSTALAARELVRASPSPAPATLRTRTFEDAGAAAASPELENTELRALTDSGILIGTPGFIAPESWGSDATARSDVYSTGAVLFELCTGRALYPDVPRGALWATVQQHDAPLVTEVVSDVHPGLVDIIARCLSRDPSARYASGKELHQALRELQDGASSRPLSASSLRSSPHLTPASSMACREVGPLIISVLSAEAPADDEWRQYLELCRRKAANGPFSVLVVTAGGAPNRRQRVDLRRLLGNGPVPAAVVSDATLVHNIVTELRWRNPEIEEFTNLDEALRHLRIDGPTAIDVRRHVNEMQHEVA